MTRSGSNFQDIRAIIDKTSGVGDRVLGIDETPTIGEGVFGDVQNRYDFGASFHPRLLARWLSGRVVRFLIDVDFDRVVDDSHREAGDGKAVAMIRVKSGSNVEGPPVGLADDDTALETSVTQRVPRMGTRVFHRVN